MKNKLLPIFLMIAILIPGILTPSAALAANPGDVLINEFNAKGTEWIELYNPTESEIDLAGWILSDEEDDEVLSGSIAAGGYWSIDTSLALGNDGDQIWLYDSDDNLIDGVAYGTKGGAPLPPYGTSTARSPDGVDTDDFARDWNVDQSPTRNATNDAPGTALGSNIILNEQNAYSPGGDFYELYNPTGSPVDLTGWQASDGDDIVDISGSILSGSYLVFENLYISSSDVVYLWDASGIRVDQLGRDGEYEDGSLQRIPDGVGPNDGYDFESSGGGVYYFDCVATPGGENGRNGCFDDAPMPLTIPEIQGDDRYSPYEGNLVVTTGVVTLITANGRDMWIQDLVGDGNPATSDGIFVDDRNGLSPQPEVGDLVRVTAIVEEQQFGVALPLTRLNNPHQYPFEIISSGNPLPAPVPLVDLPNEFIPEGEWFWEPLEGMLVSIENGFVVAPTSRYGEFGMLTETDADADLKSGYFAQTQQILIRSLGGDQVDYNPERILVDDSSLADPIVVMPGDRVRSLVGAVDYTFGNYKLQPAYFDVKTHKLPNLPASTRSGDFGDIVITTYNVENLFDLELNTPVVADAIGQAGFDPGSEWGSGDTSTMDNTIRRMDTVCQGDTDETDAFDPALEWDGFPEDTFDGLGAHVTTDCQPTTSLFFSEYVEGSSYNKVVEIYNGTGDAVNLGIEGYKVEIYFNGSSSPGQTISLSGIVADGDVFVLAHPSADSAILDETDQVSGGVLFNGDDAVVLSKGGKDDASSTPSPEELETQLSKLVLSIEIELGLPEIIVVQEVENTEILQVLGDRVNAAAGTNYQAVSFETSDARGIEVGFLWGANRVSLLDAFQMYGPDVEAAFGLSSDSPGREPLVGVFDVDGEVVTIIGNHFKSKGGDDPLFGVNWPPIRGTEYQRKGQAQVVRDFANSILDDDPSALVMVTGDLNDFQFGEPGEGPDHPLAILEGTVTEVPLTNLINLEKEAERFTYLYDGNSQVLDHMLISPAFMGHFVAVDALHFNAGYPSGLGADPFTTLRASDHDPLEGRFTFTP